MNRPSVTRFTVPRPSAPPFRRILPALLLALSVAALTPGLHAAPAPPPADAENLPLPDGIRVFQTRHYRIHTDLDEELADDLGRRMDAMYEEYVRRFATFVAQSEIPALEVYLFRRQKDYHRFTGSRLWNTGGVYMAGRNLLAAFLEGQGRDALRRTLQHEAFHQFAHNAISPNLPVWLNEGLAQLFEEGIWTGTEFWLGQVPPRRLRQLEADIKNRRLIDFVTFTGMTSEQWATRLARDHAAGATQYNQSWAMVHFLVNATDEQGNEKFRPRLVRLLELVHGGSDPKDAFAEAFSRNYKGFQDRFVEYVKGLEATPEATMIEHQGVLADLLTELRSRGQTFESMGELQKAAVSGRYRLHYTKGQLKWSTEPDLKVYFSDLNGNPFDESALYLEKRDDAPLPDIVCRWCDEARLRTRFFGNGDKLEHEVLVESVQ